MYKTIYTHIYLHCTQAAALFAAGRTAASPAVAAVCREAAQQLEALVHPRCTPITGVQHVYAGA